MKLYFLNATILALDEFDDAQKMNMIMLGFAVSSGQLPFIDEETYRVIIRREMHQPDVNLKAFEMGLQAAT